MTRRVLLTGASGFVGRHTIPLLLDQGFEVHAVARRRFDAQGAEAHAADLMDHRATADLVNALRPSHLLHLAWDVTPGRFWWDPQNLDWVASSLNLYRAFVAAGGRRATVVGSCAEYDWNAGTFEEDASVRPATLYGVAKDALHRLLATAAARDDVGLAWGRIFFLYGPHEAPERLVPSVVMPLLNNEPAAVGDGLGIRDFMHVRDAAAALVTVLASDHVGPVNIASGRHAAIREVVAMIASQIGRPDLIHPGARPTPPGDPVWLAASGEALAALGFRPAFTLQTGLEDTIAWWERARQIRSADLSGDVSGGAADKELAIVRREAEALLAANEMAEQACTRLRKELRLLHVQLAEAYCRPSPAEAQLAEIRDRLSDTERTLNGILTSRSWRVTAPVRMLSLAMRGRR